MLTRYDNPLNIIIASLIEVERPEIVTVHMACPFADGTYFVWPQSTVLLFCIFFHRKLNNHATCEKSFWKKSCSILKFLSFVWPVLGMILAHFHCPLIKQLFWQAVMQKNYTWRFWHLCWGGCRLSLMGRATTLWIIVHPMGPFQDQNCINKENVTEKYMRGQFTWCVL